MEARFAKAVDVLDAVIHELDYGQDWEGWSEDFLVMKKLRFFKEFPELKQSFFEVLDFLKKHNYLKQ